MGDANDMQEDGGGVSSARFVQCYVCNMQLCWAEGEATKAGHPFRRNPFCWDTQQQQHAAPNSAGPLSNVVWVLHPSGGATDVILPSFVAGQLADA